jgi:hypothetical protein
MAKSTLPMHRVLFAALCLASVCACSSRFDAEEWRAADLGTRDRAMMVDDLLDRYPLVGRRREEVIALLGPPTPTDKWEDWQMIYVLGPDSWFMGIDHEWLLLRLDDRGIVAESLVTVD